MMRKMFLDSLIIIVDHLLAASLGKPRDVSTHYTESEERDQGRQKDNKFFDFTRKINFHFKKIISQN